MNTTIFSVILGVSITSSYLQFPDLLSHFDYKKKNVQ